MEGNSQIITVEIFMLEQFVTKETYVCLGFIILIFSDSKFALKGRPLLWADSSTPVMQRLHCKPSPFGKQFCLAYTAIFPSYITFQKSTENI
jgi:hypothetical protein